MRDSWLVQRLHKPRSGRLGELANAFSFGGGLRNGGLSEEAIGLLKGVFSFDYMGAAEFEWGAVPEAFRVIAKANLTATTITVDDVPVYLLCDKAHRDEVESRIRGWAVGEGRLKERTNLAAALHPEKGWDSETCGWLELDNGFLFFTDRAMWEQTAALFGVDVPAEDAA